ncbi:MAG: hypothetical protein NZM04_09330 [Methylacidiphilales bacterium]|nr:hypothetical protein [Candidatus Methylacidiphilales bacterium]
MYKTKNIILFLIFLYTFFISINPSFANSLHNDISPPGGDAPHEQNPPDNTPPILFGEGVEETFRLDRLIGLAIAYRGRITNQEFFRIARSIVNNVVIDFGAKEAHKSANPRWTKELLINEFRMALKLSLFDYQRFIGLSGILGFTRDMAKTIGLLCFGIGLFSVISGLAKAHLNNSAYSKAWAIQQGIYLIFVILLAELLPFFISIINSLTQDIAERICQGAIHYRCDIAEPLLTLISIRDVHDPLPFIIFTDAIKYPIIVLLMIGRFLRDVFGVMLYIFGTVAVYFLCIRGGGEVIFMSWMRAYLRYLLLIFLLAVFYAFIDYSLYHYAEIFGRAPTWSGLRRFISMAIALAVVFVILALKSSLLILNIQGELNFMRAHLKAFIAHAFADHLRSSDSGHYEETLDHDSIYNKKAADDDHACEESDKSTNNIWVISPFHQEIIKDRVKEALHSQYINAIYHPLTRNIYHNGPEDIYGIFSGDYPPDIKGRSIKHLKVLSSALAAYRKYGGSFDADSQAMGYESGWDAIYNIFITTQNDSENKNPISLLYQHWRHTQELEDTAMTLGDALLASNISTVIFKRMKKHAKENVIEEYTPELKKDYHAKNDKEHISDNADMMELYIAHDHAMRHKILRANKDESCENNVIRKEIGTFQYDDIDQVSVLSAQILPAISIIRRVCGDAALVEYIDRAEHEEFLYNHPITQTALALSLQIKYVFDEPERDVIAIRFDDPIYNSISPLYIMKATALRYAYEIGAYIDTGDSLLQTHFLSHDLHAEEHNHITHAYQRPNQIKIASETALQQLEESNTTYTNIVVQEDNYNNSDYNAKTQEMRYFGSDVLINSEIKDAYIIYRDQAYQAEQRQTIGAADNYNNWMSIWYKIENEDNGNTLTLIPDGLAQDKMPSQENKNIDSTKKDNISYIDRLIGNELDKLTRLVQSLLVPREAVTPYQDAFDCALAGYIVTATSVMPLDNEKFLEYVRSLRNNEYDTILDYIQRYAYDPEPLRKWADDAMKEFILRENGRILSSSKLDTSDAEKINDTTNNLDRQIGNAEESYAEVLADIAKNMEN